LRRRGCVGQGLAVSVAATVATSTSSIAIAPAAAVAAPIAAALTPLVTISRVGGRLGAGDDAFNSRRATVAPAAGIAVRIELSRVAGLFHKVGDVKEGVALQADVHERGLHAWQNAGDFAVINRACEGVFVLALVINFGQGVVFDDSE